MPRVQVYDMNGEKLKQMNVSKEIFGIEPNQAVMHMAVVNYLANQRQGTQSTLTRTEVRGRGDKKGQDMPDRVLSALRSGLTVVWH